MATCACPSHDAQRCAVLRSNPFMDDLDEAECEPCGCACHYQDDEDQEE